MGGRTSRLRSDWRSDLGSEWRARVGLGGQIGGLEDRTGGPGSDLGVGLVGRVRQGGVGLASQVRRAGRVGRQSLY